MYTGIFFLIEALFYMVLLITTYFSKKRFKSYENDVYSVLILVAFLELVLELVLDYVGPLYTQIPVISYFIAKVYCVLLQFWITNLCLYVVIVTLTMKKRSNLIPKIKGIFYMGVIVLTALILSLPIAFNYDGMVAYTSGMSVNIVYISSFISCLIGFGCIIYSKEKIKNRKYIPMIAFLIIGSFGSFLQFNNPGLLLAVPIHAFITFLMYFTIENPDMKLLEEAHKAKVISDNANEEKALFVYNMTQEIRSISDKINNNADLILESKDHEQIYDTARDIKAKISEFTSVTNEILDIDSIDSSTIKIYNNKYSVKNIIRQLVNVYGDICKNKDIKFRTNIDHDIPDNLYGDGINLKEVLNTILSNSTKYTNSGFVEFNVNAIIKNDVCRLIFTIEDSGPGIKSEDINKIKIDDKSLSKSNRLITMMNGTMLISSDYGVGTKAKVILDQKIVEGEETEVSKYESTFDNISILSVDDSESGLTIIEKLLKGTNIKIDSASNGKECLDKIKIGKYDLILLDEELSQISGFELITKIKEIRNFKTPVILLTKDNSYEYNEAYLTNGFSDYILKPLKKEDLLEKIDKYTKKDKE